MSKSPDYAAFSSPESREGGVVGQYFLSRSETLTWRWLGAGLEPSWLVAGAWPQELVLLRAGLW